MANTTHPHPAAAPSTPASGSSQTQTRQAPEAPPLKWAYPFNAVKQDEAVTAQTYFTALSQAEDGFFPMGGNGLWHGGIHFGNGTAGTLDQQSGVRAIASGEVIAYRLNEKYPVATYPDKNNAMYSSGFVLIRHRLTMPRAPVAATSTPAAASASPASAAQGAPAQGTGRSAAAPQPGSVVTSTPAQPAQPADETLTFFSLYMHLMDWAGYQAADTKQDAAPSNDGAKAGEQDVQHMGYWQGSKKYRLVPGSNVNNKQEQPQKAIPAAAPSAANTADSDPLGAFIANGFKPAAPTPAPTAAASTPIDPETVYPGNGLAIRRNPLSKSPHAPNSDILGILPLGAEFTIARDADTPGWGYIGDVLKGKIYPPKAGDALDPSAKTGCVYYKGTKPLTVPAPLDQVVVLDKPFSVNAGDVVGYLGEFQRYREGQTIPPTAKRSQLHLEVFAGDEFAAFFQKSKQRAAQLSDAQKSVLVISKGAKLVSESQADTVLNNAVLLKPVANKSSGGWWALVQPMTVTAPAASATAHRQTRAQPHPIETPDGAPVWVKRPLSGTTLAADSQTAAWSKYPLNVSHTTASTVGFETAIPRSLLDKHYFGAVDDAGKHWWSTEFANEKGQIDAGWVCESAHPGTEWVSPFAWPGFEIVDHTGISLVDQFKRFLLLKNEALEGEDLTEFAPAAATVNGSDLIVKLESAIDKQGDGNGKVTAGELRRAMTKPWLARPISRLVVRFESEWGGDMSKWHSLESLLGKGRYVWQTEVDRIEKLQFWKDVEAKKVKGFPEADEVYHFHPIGIIENFNSSCRCVDVDKFIALYKERHVVDFGWYETTGSPKTRAPALNEESERNLKALIQGILNYFEPLSVRCDLPKIAYMLATARIEAYDFHRAVFFGPTKESIGYDKAEIDYGSGTTARRRALAIENENTAIGDGFKYRGRGFVQITWKKKYREFAEKLGKPLVENPDLAIDWNIALQIMNIGMLDGLFTGHSLSDYINENKSDYLNARRIINGMDKASIFAEYADKFKDILLNSR